MIGSFWNFCKACPSMPTDKFRSEYRSTYRWHEFQSKILNSSEAKQVIQKAPQLNPAINQHIHHTANQITVGQTGEMEPLVTDEKNVTHIKHDGTLSEYKKNYRPFSHYDYSENKDKLTDKTILNQNQLVDDECDNISKELLHDNSIDHDLWYKEMLELRKKAEEYKVNVCTISFPSTIITKPPNHTIITTTTMKITTSTIFTSNNSEVCGVKNIIRDQERIVGGQNADIGEWTWIAALFLKGRQHCGGSLISNQHVLSAAHCVAHMTTWDVQNLVIRLGDYNIKSTNEVNHLDFKAKKIVRHRGFDSRTLYNDISIITLDQKVEFTKQIKPICLPDTSRNYDNLIGTVIGWGSLRESGPQPGVLQEVNVPIWSNLKCRQKYGLAAPGGIVEHMICAGQINRDSCSGDSGGPLMINNGQWIQIGIVSWGIGCGTGQYPGVYTRVSSFLSWLKNNMK